VASLVKEVKEAVEVEVAMVVLEVGVVEEALRSTTAMVGL